MIPRFTTLFVSLLVCASINAQNLRTTVKSGSWSNRNTWDCTCVPAATEDAVIASGHRVVLFSGITIRNLTITQGGILTDHGLSNTITGNLVVNGTYSGRGIINLTGTNTTLQGAGTISRKGVIYVTGDKTIPASSNLIINSSDLFIQGAFTITNFGNITVGGNINGTVAASTWINETNATLNIGGSSGVPLLSTGTLHAYAAGNTVNYYATYAHTLKLPSPVSGYSTYHHLEISGTGTKTLPNGDVAVNGELTINSTFSGSGSSKKLYLRGNWINNGNFTEGTGEGTVTFDGTTDQFISRPATENLNVIVVKKASGKLILNTNVIAERGLNMISGDIDVQSYKLTLGQSPTIAGAFSWTSGTIIGKFERWISSAGVPILFPIGTSDYYRPVSVLFNSLTAGSLITEFIASSPGKNGLPLMESGVPLNNTFRDGYWSLTAANSLDTVNFNLDLTGNGFSGFQITDNTRLLTRTSLLNPWSLLGSHLARANNTIRRTNMSMLSGHFCFGDDTNCTAPISSFIAGNPDVCKSTTGELYSVVNNSPNTYNWTVSGGTIVSGQGSNVITVNWGIIGAVGNISVIEKNTCTEGAEVSLKVNIHAFPAGAITGKTNVPENGADKETYTVTALPDYSYSWTVSGGSIASGQGTNSITVNWSNSGVGSVCVIANHSPALPAVSCGQSTSSCTNITIYQVVSSSRSGNWQTAANWSCSCVPGSFDNVTVKKTHTIALNNDRTINHVNINAGGSINTNSNTFTIKGDLSVNGSLSGSGPVILNGPNTTLDGIGVITNTGPLNITAVKSILSTATLAKDAGLVSISSGVTVINHGSITLGGTLAGGNANSEWINSTNSSLSISGDLLPTSKLYASASGNMVRYFGNDAQSIVIPDAGQYDHLSISDTGVKTAPAGVLYISGDFTNNGTFQHNNGTIEFNGNSEVSGSSVTTFNNLSLASGRSLSFPPESVNVEGNIVFSSGSLFDPSLSTLILKGGVAQNISVDGANMNNLHINKSSGAVNIISPLSMRQLLQIQSSTSLNSNGNLIISSRGNTTDQDASIGVIPIGASVNGAVKVQRYMQAIGKNNRYISSPVISASPTAQFSDDFAIGNGSVRYYDEQVDGVSNNGWTSHPLTSPLQSGRGYIAWMYDGSNAVTWDVDGFIHQGTVALPVSYTTTSGGVDYDGWNLVGNPYPSAINWSGDPLAWTRSADISPIVYVPDLQGNVFRMYNYSDNSGDLTAGIIAMGQSFWVKANNPSPTLTIHEMAKTNAANGKFYRSSGKEPAQLKVKLTAGLISDAIYLKINPKATTDFDHRYDGYKLKNASINIYFIDTSQRELAMHTLPEIGKEERVKMGVEVDKPGTYQISFSGLANMGNGEWYLVDLFESQRWQISEETSYELEIRDHSKSINDRFYLTQSSEEIIESVTERVEFYPNPVKDVLKVNLPKSASGSITLLDSMGNVYWSGSGSSQFQIDMQHFPSGLYFLRIEMNGEVEILKVVKY